MIRFIENDHINRTSWDAALMRSQQPLIYAASWYLDIVAPDWSALVMDDFNLVMPLVSKRKSGINYLHQPPFCQQQGIFGGPVSAADTKAFMEAIPRSFRFAEIMLNENNPIDISGFEMLTNITLRLNCCIEELRNKYNENTKRNIKKASQSSVSLHKGFDIEKIITLFRENKGETIGKSDVWYAQLLTLSYQLRHRGIASTWSALNEHNEIIAGILTVEFEGRVTLLFSGSGSKARESGAMHFLIDSILSDVCNTHQLFDFEGSNNENLARFYLGFGGTKSEYPFVRINRLPLFVRWMKGKGISL